jgi:tail tube protein
MATPLDSSFAFAPETTWKTPVTPTRAIEWNPDSTLEWDAMPEQGQGLRKGAIANLYERRRQGIGTGTVTVKANPLTKGFGHLWRACFGTGVSTQRSASTAYQQNFSLTTAGYYMPSYTIQCGIITDDGVPQPHTFPGAMVKSWELDVPGNGMPELTVEWLCRYMDTATGYVDVASLYPAQIVTPVVSPSTYMGRDALTGGITYGGTLTPGTTTTLWTGGTPDTQWSSVNIKVDNGFSSDEADQRLGGWNQAVAVRRSIQISGNMRFTGSQGLALRDAYINQTVLPLSFTLTTPELITGSTYAAMQVVAPATMLNSGPPPGPSGDGPTMMEIEAEVLSSVAAPTALYASVVTADVAL